MTASPSAPEHFSPSRGRELALDTPTDTLVDAGAVDVVKSLGRGGIGNIRSPSRARDPAAAAYEKHVIDEAERQAPAVVVSRISPFSLLVPLC